MPPDPSPTLHPANPFGLPAWVRSLLFLDFDGVLHTDTPRGMMFTRLALLEAFLKERPHIGIVLSTSWRTEPWPVLRDILGEALEHRVVGRTEIEPRHPLVANEFGPGGRGALVRLWLATHQCAHLPFAALDDQVNLFERGFPVVLTQGCLGMTEADLVRLDRLLAVPNKTVAPRV